MTLNNNKEYEIWRLIKNDGVIYIFSYFFKKFSQVKIEYLFKWIIKSGFVICEWAEFWLDIHFEKLYTVVFVSFANDRPQKGWFIIICCGGDTDNHAERCYFLMCNAMVVIFILKCRRESRHLIVIDAYG